MSQSPQPLTIIDFFAGIGGLSIAFKKAAKNQSIPIQILEHIDISNNCKNVWELNNPNSTELYSIKDVVTYGPKLLDDRADIWLMSPPCQPFTKGGNELKEADARAQPFLKIVDLLSTTNGSRASGAELKKPSMIFIENVPEFATSTSYQKFKESLGDKNYMFIERIISPEEVGIPYHRTRFYAMAIKKALIREARPRVVPVCARSMNDILDPLTEAASGGGSLMVGRWPLQALLIPCETVRKMENYKFDIITPSSTCAGTVTGGYGSWIGRQGPLVALDASDGERFRQVMDGERIRRLSPDEILRMHGFPSDFQFPSSLGLKNIYKLLGNSVSVDAAESVMIEGLALISHAAS